MLVARWVDLGGLGARRPDGRRRRRRSILPAGLAPGSIGRRRRSADRSRRARRVPPRPRRRRSDDRLARRRRRPAGHRPGDRQPARSTPRRRRHGSTISAMNEHVGPGLPAEHARLPLRERLAVRARPSGSGRSTRGSIGVGDASTGLCGGMVYTVADLFAAGVPVPPDREPPANGSPRFKSIVRRQVESLAWLTVPVRFWLRMALGGSFGGDRARSTFEQRVAEGEGAARRRPARADRADPGRRRRTRASSRRTTR